MQPSFGGSNSSNEVLLALCSLHVHPWISVLLAYHVPVCLLQFSLLIALHTRGWCALHQQLIGSDILPFEKYTPLHPTLIIIFSVWQFSRQIVLASVLYIRINMLHAVLSFLQCNSHTS